MHESRFLRRLKFNKREYEELLDRLDATTLASRDADDHRGRDRLEYRMPDIPLTIEHPDGGMSHFLVLGRNISRRGIGVLHGGFVHRNSACQVILHQIKGDPIKIRGEVRHCRLIGGSCHEIGILFHEEIDPSLLRGSVEDRAAHEEAETGSGFLNIQGTILLVESFPPDRQLLEHQLTMFGLNIQCVATPGAALDTVKRANVDIILFGLSLSDPDTERTIGLIRETGFRAPILVLTAETNPKVLSSVRDAGATGVIAKPYYLDLLVAQLQVYLAHDDPSRPLYSTVADQSGMPPLIKDYVHLIKRIADQVQKTYQEEKWAQLGELCRQIKGSGCGYGFQNLTVAAISVLGQIDADPKSEATADAVKALLDMCHAVEFNQDLESAA